jgi:hypothetical protein
VAVTTSPISDHPDNAVDAFGKGVGGSGIDEGNDGLLMHAQGVDELAHGLQAAMRGAFRPVLEEALGGPGGLVVQESFELLFQAPGPIDAAVAFVERLEVKGIVGRSGRMPSPPFTRAIHLHTRPGNGNT